MKILKRLAVIISLIVALPLWFIWAPTGLLLFGYSTMMDKVDDWAKWIEDQLK